MFNFEILRYFMVSTAFTSFIFGIIFLLLFKQTKQRYMLYWGLAFVTYCLMFFVDFSNTGLHQDDSIYVLFRQFFSLLGASLIFAGTSHFFGSKASRVFFFLFCFFVLLLGISLHWYTIYAIFIMPVIMYCSFTLIRSGLMFILNNQENNNIEQSILSFAIILWSVYSNNFPFMRDYLGLTISNYFISLILLNGIVILFIVVHFKRSQTALAKQEAHYRMLVENASGLIFLYNHEKMKFDYISPSIHLFFGYSSDALYADPWLLLAGLDQEDTEKIKALFFTPSDAPVNFIFKVHHLTQAQKWYELFSTPIPRGDGFPVGVEFIIRDVTARMEAEHNFQRSEKARKALVEDISHELRTPVTLIRGYSESILNGMVQQEDYLAYIEIIHSKIIILNTLLEDLLQVSKFTSHSVDYKFYEQPAALFFDHILTEYKIFIENNKHNCICQNLIDKSTIILVDKYRIGQVFSNLVNNSLKYTPQGNTIEISCYTYTSDIDEKDREASKQDVFTPASEKICVRVKDSGKGISAKDIPHIFKRNFRGTDNTSGDRGFGLGLYISKEIVKHHGEEIWAENNTDQGASFFFTLPCYELEDTQLSMATLPKNSKD